MSVLARILKTRFQKRLFAACLIGLVGLLWGILLLNLQLGYRLRTAAYDLPFLISTHSPPEEIVLVHLDEASHEELNQPLAQPWDRKLHAQMIDKLNDLGASVIAFDILFHDDLPEDDAILAAAMQKHGKVILAAEFVRKNVTEGAEMDRMLVANPTLRRAAAGWGLTYLSPEVDGVVRRIQHVVPTPFNERPSFSEMVRMKYQEDAMQADRGTEWIRFYGDTGTFPSYSYSGVLVGRGVPEGAFKDKIVIIGAKQQAGLADAGKDMFPTPYSGLGLKNQQYTAGMEIHANALGNLIEGRRMKELDKRFERVVLIVAALVFSALTCLLAPIRGISLAVLLAGGIAACGLFAHISHGFLFLWTLPAFGQMPLIAALSLLAHYFIEYSARWRLRRAFKSYMSDEQARQIDESDVSLELGGKEVQATIFFSDLAGFTAMAEGLPPDSVSKALISYFERATEGILDNHGTIIKYVGDAVMATWGAPLKVDREADRAIDAAIQMQTASALPISLQTSNGTIEKVLETRVGINSGSGLAGNLGSKRRFDYSVIGDTTNTAARLEGLNKMLGTSILVAESVIQKCEEPERFLKRRMGSYVLKGRKNSVVVYEILGYVAQPGDAVRKRSAEYLEGYENGLKAYEAGNLAEAAELLRACAGLHDRLADDPASRLMLNQIERMSDGGVPENWVGEVVLDSK